MKALIWIGCILGYAILQSAFKCNGLTLGFIPTALLFWLTWWIARTLCKKHDEHNRNDSVHGEVTDKPSESYKSRFTECPKCGYIAVFEKECPQCSFVLPTEIQEDNTSQTPQILFCRKCGAKLLANAQFCKECGTEIM